MKMSPIVAIAIARQAEARHQQQVADAVAGANATFTTFLGQLEELARLAPEDGELRESLCFHFKTQLTTALGLSCTVPLQEF